MFRSKLRLFKKFTSRLFHRSTPTAAVDELLLPPSNSLHSIYMGSSSLKEAFSEALQDPEIVLTRFKSSQNAKTVVQLSDLVEGQSVRVENW
ncbi:hypothetical protein E3P91_03645 [Wallemia ichthyophaga]|nr:hypothetical protein E3P91_03645 [Wallemia ichthyophaga]